MLAATLTLSGILMALLRRAETGEGDYLDVAMMESILSCMPNSMGAVFAEQRPPVPDGERIWGGSAMYRIYETQDGKHVGLGGSELKFARNLLTALNREDLFALCEEPPGAAQVPVIEYFNGLFKTRTQAQWVTFFAELDVCFAPVNNLREGLDLAQTRHREMCLTDDLGREHLGIPIPFRPEPGVVRTLAPTLGEHSSQILATLGRSVSEIAQLRGEGVI